MPKVELTKNQTISGKKYKIGTILDVTLKLANKLIKSEKAVINQ